MTLTVADTAYSIAVVRAEEKELFSDPYAHLFAEAGAHAEEGTRRYLALPFFREGIRLRTRFIDDFVRANLGNEVVILGAGFDARAMRMPELARKRVVEIDSPENRRRVNELGRSDGGGFDGGARIVGLARGCSRRRSTAARDENKNKKHRPAHRPSLASCLGWPP